jgi:hypothetical protein
MTDAAASERHSNSGCRAARGVRGGGVAAAYRVPEGSEIRRGFSPLERKQKFFRCFEAQPFIPGYRFKQQGFQPTWVYPDGNVDSAITDTFL